MKKVRSALSAVDGVTIDKVAMPDVAEITLDTDKVKLSKVLRALKKAGYKSSERKADKEEK